MFMMIENEGVAPLQSFTVLGLSTARGNSEKIGQFGSGSKHGILTCLRQGINPTIYLGENRLEFGTMDANMGEKAFKQLTYTFDGQTKELPMALEFGALDWNGLDMGLREFVSNAIDAGGFNVTVTPTTEPSANKTRIYLPFNPDVAKFYTSLRERFLHFSPEFDAKCEVLIKKERTTVKFYRKGVFVRQSDSLSLFDYNFGDNVKIDESRNMDDWSTKYHAGNCLARASVEIIAELFRNFENMNDKWYESSISLSTSEFSTWMKKGKENRANWLEAWAQVFGKDAIAANAQTQGQLIAQAQNKGEKVVCVPFNFLMVLHDIGIRKVNSALENVNEEGEQVSPASEAVIEKVENIWDKLVELGMTKNKTFPKVNTFISLAEGQSQRFGFQLGETVNFEETRGVNTYTILHELGHYITDASDNTHDFTDFFCKVATILLEKF